MIIETMNNGVYQCIDDDKVLLTITSLGNNVYRAINNFTDITAEITPVDDYYTKLVCIEHKRRDKNGRYRKTTKLLESNLCWLDHMLEKKGFIREKKTLPR